MKVLIVTDIRIKEEDGNVLLEKQFYHIFKRYFGYFGKVDVFCGRESNDRNVETFLGNEFFSSKTYYKSLLSIIIGDGRKKLKECIKKADLVIGRFHSISAIVASDLCKKYNVKFMAEVMGDAWDGYWNHGFTGKLVAPIIYLKTKKAVKNAKYALYVTKEFLQKRYPCKGLCINASNVELSFDELDILEKRKKRNDLLDKKYITLMTSANVDVKAKGHRYVISSIPLLKKKGIEVKYKIAGGGKKDVLFNLAKKKNVLDSVVFLGRLSGSEVCENLDSTDIYIQPSLQEGLPRAMIEAMSRGCVCLGSRTGGIPELVKNNCIFKRKSAKAISKAIIEILDEDFNAISRENYETSLEYERELLQKRRDEFFEKIKNEK